MTAQKAFPELPENPIRAARRKAGISQEELARRSGISRVSVSYVESGKQTPHPSTLKALADALGVPVSTIEPPDPNVRDQYIARGLIQAVEEGELTTEEAMQALRDVGILRSRRSRRVERAR